LIVANPFLLFQMSLSSLTMLITANKVISRRRLMSLSCYYIDLDLMMTIDMAMIMIDIATSINTFCPINIASFDLLHIY